MRLKARSLLLLTVLGLLGVLVYFYAFMDEDVEDSELQSRERRLLEQVTRDPNRVVYFNYPITNNVSASKEPIDIAVEMPPWQEIDKHIVVVTGFKQTRAYVGLGMIASVQAHMPVKKIIVYNLGIHPKIVKQMQQMCNVEVRRFNFTRYPRHVSRLENGAWKIFALREVMKEYGGFFYASPQVRFRAPINFIIPYLKKHHGILARTNPSNLTVEVSHPSLFRFFRSSAARFVAAHPEAHSAIPHMWLAVNNSETERQFWKPMMDCASNWRCIAPQGSTAVNLDPRSNGTSDHTHQYEASLLSLLLYRNFDHGWCQDVSLEATFKRLADVIHHLDLHDYLWAHYCNPPKKEVDCSIQRKLC
ncbi:uncharacterized protein [Diadema setosum]|uniref:uncharacterized protein n=1 Tax=Diadema setosum TaxID=31175 RepID=UPI003B3B6E9A